MSSIMVREESIVSAMNELSELTKDHYQEIAQDQEDIPLDPDWLRYVALERAERFCLVTVREDGKLVGYSAFFVHSHIHYSSTKFGINDVIYLAPRLRKTGVGAELLFKSEEALRARGVKKVFWHVKPNVVDFGPALRKLGYNDEEVVWAKVLRNKE